MARLNEITAPAESIDALKRRFVRQNRELARINSNQSVRIRNLESEISRLLSENITFREHNIKLQYEIDRYQARGTWNDAETIRSKLEAKLAELGDMVKDLGMAHSSLSFRRTSRRRSTQESSPKKSPDQRNWKNALTLSEVTGVSETSRLPPIIEDKYFPRRTLESEELLGMIGNTKAIESPELGPPPIATLDEGDPIKYDRMAMQLEAQEGLHNAGPTQFPCTANLETRKKRRESLHRPESGRSNTSGHLQTERASVEDVTESAPQPLKAGAKRKLNIREDDLSSETVEVSGREALKLDQKYCNTAITENGKQLRDDSSRLRANLGILQYQSAKQQSPLPPQEKAKQAISSSAMRARKALGPKSVNKDPLQSPSKMNDSVFGDKIQDGQENTDKKSRHHEQSVMKSSSSKTARQLKTTSSTKLTTSNTQEVVTNSDTQNLSPLSLQSNQSSGDGRARPGLRDMPPLLEPYVDADSITGRATRRPRGSVSYTEPNLRDKMRRPTKDLVDAVGADDRPQVLKVQEVKLIGPEAEQSRIRTVVVKREDPGEEMDSAWKELPLPINDERPRQDTTASPETTSPLKSKPPSAKELTASVITNRGFADHGNFFKEEVKSSSSSNSTKPKSRKRRGDEPGEQNEHEDLFELRSSSPIDGIKEIESQRAKRLLRRHSGALIDQEPMMSRATTIGSTSRRVDRRGESALSSVAMMGKEQANGKIGLKGVKSVGGLQRSGAETSLSRAERSASRRRSMII